MTEERKHLWVTWKNGYEVCFNCGVIKRADKKNGQCKGIARIKPRASK